MFHSLHPGRRQSARVGHPATPWVSLLFLALLTVSAATASAGVTVTPWGPPDITEFPPDNPPPDLPPGEDADATAWIGWSGGAVGGSWNPADSTFTVTSLGDITLTGHTDIRVPSNADSALRAHESGHDSLNHYEYDQNAKKKVEDAMRGFTGMKFKGKGATNAERAADALAQAQAERDRRMQAAMDAIFRQMNVLNSTYDGLTDHGTSETVNTAQGITQAIAEHCVAPPAGQDPLVPDGSKSNCAALGGSQGFFDEAVGSLVVVGPGLINEAQFPTDPIVGRGAVHVQHFLLIGAQENGTVHLADTYVQIVDTVTGDSLLDGYLAEAAYMPANVPGYLGMIQAYLVIPPPWAHGIENTIGSPFLAGMEAANMAGELTTVWLYSPLPLFDLLGNPLVPPEGVPLALTLGIANPVIGVVDPPRPPRLALTVRPQPARGTVRFSWRPTAAPLDLEIFDAAGARRWATRLDGTNGEWNWQGVDQGGQSLRAGVYFARLHGEGLDLRARVVLVR